MSSPLPEQATPPTSAREVLPNTCCSMLNDRPAEGFMEFAFRLNNMLVVHCTHSSVIGVTCGKNGVIVQHYAGPLTPAHPRSHTAVYEEGQRLYWDAWTLFNPEALTDTYTLNGLWRQSPGSSSFYVFIPEGMEAKFVNSFIYPTVFPIVFNGTANMDSTSQAIEFIRHRPGAKIEIDLMPAIPKVSMDLVDRTHSYWCWVPDRRKYYQVARDFTTIICEMEQPLKGQWFAIAAPRAQGLYYE